jgi:hypothetical protein
MSSAPTIERYLDHRNIDEELNPCAEKLAGYIFEYVNGRGKFSITLQLVLLCATGFSCASWRDSGLERNRELWNRSNIDDYRMTIKIFKTGHAAPMGAAMIEVRDGQMVSTTRVEGEWLGGYVEKCEPYDTIPEIFSLIEWAEKENPDELEVSYHPTLAYPTKVQMDPDRGTMDDELFWQVLQFERIE